jgi:imidazolonepropionase-like amidohydrolase
MRHSYAILADTDLIKDERLKYLPPSSTAWWINMVKASGKVPEEEWKKRKAIVQGEDWLVAEMQKAGVGILAGTDNGNPFCYPGFSLHDELEFFVKAGLTPMQALKTATLNPARFLNRSDYSGRIEAGKMADLVLLNDNPLVDIRNTRKIFGVILNGQHLDREKLNEMLTQIEVSAKN